MTLTNVRARSIIAVAFLPLLFMLVPAAPAQAAVHEQMAYLGWSKITKKTCKKKTPVSKPANVIDRNRDVRNKKRGHSSWKAWKTTGSATGHLKTNWQYQDRVKTAMVIKSCNGKNRVKTFAPVSYEHRTRAINFNCYGASCRHAGTVTGKWNSGKW